MLEKIYIDASYRQLNKFGEELCGDRVKVKRGEKCIVLVLADGLGSGVKANILSTLTSTIISEMVSSGMPLQDALETIASTLPVCKEREIAYSTFTILQIFYNGNAYIVEFDNPSVVVLRNQKVLNIPKEIHQIAGKKIQVRKLEVEAGDTLVAFSDGVLHAGLEMTLNFGWGQDEVEHFLENHLHKDDDAKKITRVLLSNVNYLYGGTCKDDSSVACMKILPAIETRVMVGPPSKKEDDEKVVKWLLQATGKKICCGGTTSNIVSAVLQKPITIDQILSLQSDVPPKGYIEGIDLVTEGVLTLQKTNRYLEKATMDSEFEEYLLTNKQEDGASCLCRALLQSNVITFMVGLSDNPAHESIAYSPISLNAKIALIKEIQSYLKKLGKICRIEMN